MTENKIEFFHTKWKLFFGVIFSLLFVIFGVLMGTITYTEKSIPFTALALFLIVLFSFFAVANILKMIRGYPYIIITDEYLQLDSFTKSEVTIYFTDIEYIKVSEVSFQSIIEIILYDEDEYFSQLSFHNKMRLCMNRVTGFTLFTISAKAVRKQERARLLKTLDHVIQEKVIQRSSAPIIETALKENAETEFMERYDPAPQINSSIDRSYFLKSYGHGLILFAISFIFFYLLISKDDSYLFYIIVNFIVYPFAKVLIDWLFGFKLKHSLDKQKGFTYYLDQLRFIFSLFLFHVSIFVAPIGILFLLIRFVVIRIRR